MKLRVAHVPQLRIVNIQKFSASSRYFNMTPIQIETAVMLQVNNLAYFYSSIRYAHLAQDSVLCDHCPG